MSSITVIVRRLEPDGTRVPVSTRRLLLMRPNEASAPDVARPIRPENDQTLTERVCTFLEQRSA